MAGQLFGEYVKNLEAKAESTVDPLLPFVVRLDGHKFSKLTKTHFQRPFDEAFADGMINVAKTLMNEYRPVTAFTSSDEITLVFAPVHHPELDEKHIFGGRAQKMVSLMAGLASSAFVREFPHLAGIAYFDARVIPCGSWADAYRCVMWRNYYDARTNGVQTLAQHHIGKSKIKGVSSRDLIHRLSEIGVRYEDQPMHLTQGVFVKWFTNARSKYEMRVVYRRLHPQMPDDDYTFVQSKTINDMGDR